MKYLQHLMHRIVYVLDIWLVKKKRTTFHCYLYPTLVYISCILCKTVYDDPRCCNIY